MGPSRKAGVSDPSSSKPSTSTPQKNSSKRPQHKKHPAPPEASNALPGVQKIKAALRQTRRLLAKDNLAADKRVATERRLKSLEGDLEKAEQGRLERAMATRYHKIKFFERQKVSRKVQQTKRKLAAATEKGERKEWEARLAELRVDLSYIVHYPKTKKYISLFPPEARNAKERQSAADAAREAKEKSETDRQREEIRAWMREQMDSGALSWEPEVELEKSERKAGSASKAAPTMEVEETKKSKAKKTDQKGASTAKGAKASGVANDDFFGADEGEDEDSSSDGGESDGDVDMDED